MNSEALCTFKIAIDEVEADWGKPAQQEPAEKGIYATYTDEHVVFGFNKGSLIFDVRSSDTALQELTLKQIESTLGKPDNNKVYGWIRLTMGAKSNHAEKSVGCSFCMFIFDLEYALDGLI